MLTSLDRDESRKKFSGSRKKILEEKFLDLKFGEICARTDVGIKVSANETRCLCSLPVVGV